VHEAPEVSLLRDSATLPDGRVVAVSGSYDGDAYHLVIAERGIATLVRESGPALASR